MTEVVSPNGTAAEVDDVLAQIMGRIAPAGEAKSNLKVMVYSEPGGRKSSFCGSAPNNLIVDTEDGLTALKNPAAGLDLSTVSVLPFKSFYQVEQLVDRMNKDVPQLAQFETLSIDTMSELHKKGLAEITEREFEKAPASRNRFVAETEDHTENNEHIRRLVSSLRDLDRNLIITAHARTVQQKDKSIKIFPDFSEKLANTLAGMMDVVAYVEKKEINGEIHAVWWCDSNGYITAKNRIGLPAQIVDPTWETIWEFFEKHKATEAKASQ